MQTQTKTIIFAILLYITALSCHKGIAVRYDGKSLTENQLKSYSLINGIDLKKERGKAITNLLIREAWAESLTTPSQNLKERLQSAKKSLAIDFFLSKNLEKVTSISEEEIKQSLRFRYEKRRIFMIVVKSRDEAALVQEQLKSGLNPERIALKYSIDPEVKTNKGDLGFRTRAELPQEIIDDAFSLPLNGVSAPIKTAIGWEVIVAAEIKIVDYNQYKNQIPEIKKTLIDEKKNAMRDHLAERLKGTFKIQVFDDKIDDEPSIALKEGDEKKIIAVVDTSMVSLSDLKLFMGSYFRGSGTSHVLGKTTKKQFLDILLKNEILFCQAIKEGVLGNPEFKDTLWNIERELYANEAKIQYLKNYKVPESEILTFYDKNWQEFSRGKSYRLFFLLSESEEPVNEAVSLLKKGADFRDVAMKLSEDPEAGKNGGDAGFLREEQIKKSMPEDVANAIISAGEKAIIGPAFTPYGWQVFQISEIKAGEREELSAVFERVRASYIKSRQKELIEREGQSLYKTLNPKIYN